MWAYINFRCKLSAEFFLVRSQWVDLSHPHFFEELINWMESALKACSICSSTFLLPPLLLFSLGSSYQFIMWKSEVIECNDLATWMVIDL